MEGIYCSAEPRILFWLVVSYQRRKMDRDRIVKRPQITDGFVFGICYWQSGMRDSIKEWRAWGISRTWTLLWIPDLCGCCFTVPYSRLFYSALRHITQEAALSFFFSASKLRLKATVLVRRRSEYFWSSWCISYALSQHSWDRHLTTIPRSNHLWDRLPDIHV